MGEHTLVFHEEKTFMEITRLNVGNNHKILIIASLHEKGDIQKMQLFTHFLHK